VVVETPKLREQIRAAAWNQAQVTDASDVIVLCTRTTLDEAYVDHYLELIATTRSLTIDKLDGLKKMILGSVAHRSKHEVIEWNKRQTYIALGVLLSTAALHTIDASPMEGFDPLKVDEILGLKWLKLTHVNDSKCELGGKKDRHEHIGKGHIGNHGISALLSTPPFMRIDWLLETEPEGRSADMSALVDIRKKALK
jgi:nitroreductase